MQEKLCRGWEIGNTNATLQFFFWSKMVRVKKSPCLFDLLGRIGKLRPNLMKPRCYSRNFIQATYACSQGHTGDAPTWNTSEVYGALERRHTRMEKGHTPMLRKRKQVHHPST